MSKITKYDFNPVWQMMLYIAVPVPIWQQWASKGQHGGSVVSKVNADVYTAQSDVRDLVLFVLHDFMSDNLEVELRRLRTAVW